MSYVIEGHWAWLFEALVLGVILGAASWRRFRKRWVDRAVKLALLVLVVGGGLAALKVLPGRAASRLDLTLLLIVFFGFGCLFGWLLRNLADVPSLASVDWPAMPPMPPDQVRPPYLSKPGRVPWSVMVAGPEAVADWEAHHPARIAGGILA